MTRKWLLTQNRELREIGVFNWTLPAFVVRLKDGTAYNACPSAGVCAKACYARQGTFNFHNVKSKHVANLERTINDLPAWEAEMTAEVQHKRYSGKHVRIHDSGDFHSDDYTSAWLRIIRSAPTVTFYAYTKEVDRFRRLIEPDPPSNFRWLYSYGGTQDGHLDPDRDRVADVFPSFEAMEREGYSTQHESDLQAIYNDNNRVGIPYNNIPHVKKLLAGRTFQEWQQTVDENRAAKIAGDTGPRKPHILHLCECGQPFADKPADGCRRFGHAAHIRAEDCLEPEADPEQKCATGGPGCDSRVRQWHTDGLAPYVSCPTCGWIAFPNEVNPS